MRPQRGRCRPLPPHPRPPPPPSAPCSAHGRDDGRGARRGPHRGGLGLTNLGSWPPALWWRSYRHEGGSVWSMQPPSGLKPRKATHSRPSVASASQPVGLGLDRRNAPLSLAPTWGSRVGSSPLAGPARRVATRGGACMVHAATTRAVSSSTTAVAIAWNSGGRRAVAKAR